MSPQLVGLAIDPFTMRLVGETPEPRVARPGIAPVNQDGHENLAAVLRQSPRKLAFRRQPGNKPDQHLRRLIRVGNRHNARARFSFWAQPQPLAINPLENRPAHHLDREGIRLRHFRRSARALGQFQ